MAENDRELLDCLRDDYNIVIEPMDVKEEQRLEENGYELPSDEAVASINALM